MSERSAVVTDPRADGILTRVVRVQAFQIMLVLIGIWLVFAAMEPNTFASVGNMRLIVQNASILAILGVGMTFVIITAGIDLSIGSVMVFSGVVGAKVMMWQGGDGWGTASLGIAAAIVSGLVLGGVQRRPHRKGEDPAADRHAGHPGNGARSCTDRHEGRRHPRRARRSCRATSATATCSATCRSWR